MTDKPTAAPDTLPESTTSPTSKPTKPSPTSNGVGSIFAQLWSALAIPLLSIVLALIVGAVVIILTSSLKPGASFDLSLPLDAYKALWDGSLGSDNGRVTTLVQAAPLILAGLGVGLGFKAGLFNIGGNGQFLMGGISAVAASLVVQDQPPIIAIPFAVIVGAIGGAVWGFIPGALKAFRGAHEVVTTIMMNFIAYATLAWLVTGPLRQPRAPQPITPDVGPAAFPIIFGRDGHLGILLAFLAVPIVWFLLNKMTIGFEIKAVGANPEASRYAGMKPRRLIMLTMSVAGMLAGLAGVITILGINHRMNATYPTQVGFDAITVALLARSNPIGIMFSGIFFGALEAGASQMQIQAGVPVELISLLEAIILFFLVINPVLRRLFRLRGVKSGLGTTDTITRTYGSEAIR